MREAIFLTTWAIQHTIDTNSGGVDGPIRIAVMERDHLGVWQTRLLADNEVDDQGQAVESARQSLRDWRDSLAPPDNGGDSAGGISAPPTL